MVQGIFVLKLQEMEINSTNHFIISKISAFATLQDWAFLFGSTYI